MNYVLCIMNFDHIMRMFLCQLLEGDAMDAVYIIQAKLQIALQQPQKSLPVSYMGHKTKLIHIFYLMLFMIKNFLSSLLLLNMICILCYQLLVVSLVHFMLICFVVPFT